MSLWFGTQGNVDFIKWFGGALLFFKWFCGELVLFLLVSSAEFSMKQKISMKRFKNNNLFLVSLSIKKSNCKLLMLISIITILIEKNTGYNYTSHRH